MIKNTQHTTITALCDTCEQFGVHLHSFRLVAVPENVLCDDGFNGDSSCPVAVFNEVGYRTEVDRSSAANPLPAGSPGQIHHTGGQGQTGTRHTVLCNTTRWIINKQRAQKCLYRLIQSSI